NPKQTPRRGELFLSRNVLAAVNHLEAVMGKTLLPMCSIAALLLVAACDQGAAPDQTTADPAEQQADTLESQAEQTREQAEQQADVLEEQADVERAQSDTAGDIDMDMTTTPDSTTTTTTTTTPENPR